MRSITVFPRSIGAPRGSAKPQSVCSGQRGVVAEILLFSVSGFFVAPLGPMALLMLAGISGVARWTVLAQTTDMTSLVAVQVLHAITFGAVHLGAMHFVARNAPPGLSATAQGLYASASGLAMGLAMIGAGSLFANFGGKAFFAMAIVSAIGTGLAAPVMAPESQVIVNQISGIDRSCLSLTYKKK